MPLNGENYYEMGTTDQRLLAGTGQKGQLSDMAGRRQMACALSVGRRSASRTGARREQLQTHAVGMRGKRILGGGLKDAPAVT